MFQLHMISQKFTMSWAFNMMLEHRVFVIEEMWEDAIG